MSTSKTFEGSATADIYYKNTSDFVMMCFVAIAGTDDTADKVVSDVFGNFGVAVNVGSSGQYSVGSGNNNYYLALQSGIQEACKGRTVISTGQP